MFKNVLSMDDVTILTKKQLMLIGGSGSGTCAFQGGNGYAGISGVSREQAEASASVTGGHWCCDSCSTVSWLSADHKEYLSEMQ